MIPRYTRPKIEKISPKKIRRKRFVVTYAITDPLTSSNQTIQLVPMFVLYNTI